MLCLLASKLAMLLCAIFIATVSLVCSTHTVEIAAGVFYPVVQLGACTDCSTKQVCCGSNLSASLPLFAKAHGEGDVVAIDTQLRYNDTSVVAQALATIALPRNMLWITSKIDPKVYCNTPDPKATALSMIQESLQQLNMSYIDLLLLHEPCDRKGGKPHPSDQLAWNALMEAVHRKWVRAIGIDKFAISQIEALNGTKPAVLMAPMSLTSHDEEMLKYCKVNEIHYNAYGILHGCKFTDTTVMALGKKYNATASQICGAWTRQRGCSMAIGAGTDLSKMGEYIHEDLDIFRFNMTEQEMSDLSNSSRPKK